MDISPFATSPCVWDLNIGGQRREEREREKELGGAGLRLLPLCEDRFWASHFHPLLVRPLTEGAYARGGVVSAVALGCVEGERGRERESASASLFACRAMKIAVSFLLRSAGGGRIAPTPSTLAKQRGRSKEEGKKPCSLREMWTETPLLSLQEAKRVQALDPAL